MKPMEYQELLQKADQPLESLLSVLTAAPSLTPTVREQTRGLFSSHVEEVARCAERLATPSHQLEEKNPIRQLEALPQKAKVAAQGLPGAYSHIATEQLFSQPDITFFPTFEEVAIAVETGRVAYGVLPFENSSVGTVADITQYIYRHHCYINTMLPVKIQHCLCVHPDTQLEEVTLVISHPQALDQCKHTLSDMGLSPMSYANTAMAAQEVSRGAEPLACLCSARSAEIYGLTIVKEDMQDLRENYTRFVLIGREAVVLPGADTISLALSFPNEPGALGQLLTRFLLFRLDLTRIQSLPIAGPGFAVRFHLDFTGHITDPAVAGLLGHMYDAYEDFQFLGNYRHLPAAPTKGETYDND